MSNDFNIRSLIQLRDYDALDKALSDNPGLANAGISLRPDGTKKAHPLHRICDAVFAKAITEDEAIKVAAVFLAHGADINGDKLEEGHEPLLVSAASLHAEQLAIFFIDKGANVHVVGFAGETPLHWAAYCGRDKLVEKLIQLQVPVNQTDKAHNGTPLGWALHSMMQNDTYNTHNQPTCIKLLLQAGAEVAGLSPDATKYLEHLNLI